MFTKCLRMDEKCLLTHLQLFPTFDPNAAQNVENKDISPVATKLISGGVSIIKDTYNNFGIRKGHAHGVGVQSHYKIYNTKKLSGL